MRYESCITCKHDNKMNAVTVIESLSPRAHHHHTITCTNCKKWWFDDITLNAQGIPIINRRDSEFCACPENEPYYMDGIFSIAGPESECNCTVTKLTPSHYQRMGE
jgi:hypothetical protein